MIEMNRLLVVVASVLLSRAGAGVLEVRNKDSLALPADLLIGAGVAAVQVEGAWNEDGKAESDVDHVFHLGMLSSMGVTDPHAHDVAADSYHRYKEDIKMAAALKLQVYRFSISWPRILPNISASQPNEKGVQYYHNVIDEILRYNMTPMVTLYQFDHPQVLEDQFRGWWSPKMIPVFKEYARFVFNEYGEKVKHWTTVNEPSVLCTYFAKLHVLSGLYTEEEVSNHYACQRNLVLGHAEAYRLFKEEKHEGMIGLNTLFLTASPASTEPEDVYAAEALNSLFMGTIFDPIMFGDYSQIAKDVAGKKLEPFTDAEKQLLKGSTDYIGMNVYIGMKAAWRKPTAEEVESASLLLGKMLDDLPNVAVDIPNLHGPESVQFFEGIHSESIQNSMVWAWKSYKKPLFITENGFGDVSGHGKRDQLRAAYFSRFLRTMVSTINTFEVKVIGYCAWSLIDAFEWAGGLTNRSFGIVYVDYANKTLDRSFKESSDFWINLAETRMIPVIEPENSGALSTVSKPCFLLTLFVMTFISLSFE